MPDPLDYGLTKAAYSVNETLKEIPCGRTKLYDLLKRGELAHGKVGKKTIIYGHSIAALLAKARVQP